jgi:protoporphyrinogen oxidase
MNNRSYAHIVVGGGISGLSAAHYAAAAGTDTLVLEGNRRVGGCIHTLAFPELDGFWVEAGSHSCFNSYGNLLNVMESLGLLTRATPKSKQGYRLWRDGERRSILSALHLPELAFSLPKLLTTSKSGSSVAEYYGRCLGERNYQDLFGPAFRSVLCQSADEFPADTLFRKKPRRKDVLRSFTMPNGLSDIAAGIANGSGVEIAYEQRARHIESSNGGYIVHTEQGGSHHCDRLTLAVPPDAAAGLLADVAPDAARAVGRIGMAEIDTLVLAFRKEDLSVAEMAGLISVDGSFLSAVSRDFMEDPRFRGIAFHFPGGQLDETGRVGAACEALGVWPEKIAATAHVRNRLPSLRQGHQALIAELDRALTAQPLAVTGNWFLGVSIEDCVSRSLSEHERLFGARQAPA